MKKRANRLSWRRVTLTELRQAVKSSVPGSRASLIYSPHPRSKNGHACRQRGHFSHRRHAALFARGQCLRAPARLGKRLVALDQFYVAYRKTAMKVGEFITAIEFDVPRPVSASPSIKFPSARTWIFPP